MTHEASASFDITRDDRDGARLSGSVGRSAIRLPGDGTLASGSQTLHQEPDCKPHTASARSSHELHGHVPFDQLMIGYESGIYVGAFDGWVEVDSSGTITALWVDAFNDHERKACELQFVFPKHETDWLACRIRDAVQKEFGNAIRGAILDRNPQPAGIDPGPSQEQRL